MNKIINKHYNLISIFFMIIGMIFAIIGPIPIFTANNGFKLSVINIIYFHYAFLHGYQLYLFM